ncbi:hypothetical protein MTO96_021372 [Rhipicephalus appendiculatus]
MMMNEEAQRMLMAMIKESLLQATPVVADALATRESTDKNPDALEWTPGETKLLLDYYYKNFLQVGPFKKFKNKKMLFKKVSQDLADVLGCSKTPQQRKNRLKTVRRQKKKASDNNNKSGAPPCPIPFEDEVRKIESIDDSMEPEVQRDSFGVTYKATSS